jgi:DNA replication protein DnaC
MIKKLTSDEVVRISKYKKTSNNFDNSVYQHTQKAASDSLQFGFEIRSDGYNIFALGDPGLGKHELIMNLAREIAQQEETPDDFVYVYNFKDPDRPMYLQFPPGKGSAFAKDMNELI